MLIEYIIQHYINKGIKDYVIESDMMIALNLSTDKMNISSIEDVRSATFYACGLAQKNNSSVVLILRKEYLPNTLTGLTEAWFQTRQIIVLALGTHILNDDLGYLKNCTSRQYKIQTVMDFNECVSQPHLKSIPVLFLIDEELPIASLGYKINVRRIESILTSTQKLFIYSQIITEKIVSEKIEYVDSRDKYGMISKYMGYCIGSKSTSILITDYTSVKYDINIFNNRYLDKCFKVIISGQEHENHVQHWLIQNGIAVVINSTVEDALSCVLSAEKATVAFVKMLEETA